jgi:hypothetical protein
LGESCQPGSRYRVRPMRLSLNRSPPNVVTTIEVRTPRTGSKPRELHIGSGRAGSCGRCEARVSFSAAARGWRTTVSGCASLRFETEIAEELVDTGINGVLTRRAGVSRLRAGVWSGERNVLYNEPGRPSPDDATAGYANHSYGLPGLQEKRTSRKNVTCDPCRRRRFAAARAAEPPPEGRRG